VAHCKKGQKEEERFKKKKKKRMNPQANYLIEASK
jgi:hypothetical protein